MLTMRSGRLSRNAIITIVATVLTGALLLTVWIVVVNTRPDTPTTLAGVKAEAMRVVEEIHDLVPPASVVDSTDETETVDCVKGGGSQMMRIRRVIVVPEDFDRRQWTLDLEETFRAREGWASDFEQLPGQAGTRVRLVNPQTLIFSVVSTAEAGVPHLTILSTTRCSNPD
jgi:cytochrome bd-type quinol oxidase subunit 1